MDYTYIPWFCIVMIDIIKNIQNLRFYCHWPIIKEIAFMLLFKINLSNIFILWFYSDNLWLFIVFLPEKITEKDVLFSCDIYGDSCSCGHCCCHSYQDVIHENLLETRNKSKYWSLLIYFVWNFMTSILSKYCITYLHCRLKENVWNITSTNTA